MPDGSAALAPAPGRCPARLVLDRDAESGKLRPDLVRSREVLRRPGRAPLAEQRLDLLGADPGVARAQVEIGRAQVGQADAERLIESPRQFGSVSVRQRG